MALALLFDKARMKSNPINQTQPRRYEPLWLRLRRIRD